MIRVKFVDNIKSEMSSNRTIMSLQYVCRISYGPKLDKTWMIEFRSQKG